MDPVNTVVHKLDLLHQRIKLKYSISNLILRQQRKNNNISDNFSQREFAAALQHLKPGKALGPDSICSELILHSGAALVT